MQKAVEKTRKFIVNLYVKCETDYVNGVKIFEAIVESKIVETTQKQIENLKKEATKIIQETKKSSEPVKSAPPPVIIVGNNTQTSSVTPVPLISTQQPNAQPLVSSDSSSKSLISQPSVSTPIVPINSLSSTTSSIPVIPNNQIM